MAEIRENEADDIVDDIYDIYVYEKLRAAEIQKLEGMYEKVVSLNDSLWFSEACLYYTHLGKSLPQVFPEFFIDKGYLFVIEYLPILVYFLVAVFLSNIILSVSYTLVVQKPETEKTSGYECGFETYEDARHKFNVRFYLLAILFILFDIETMFLIPWCVTLSLVNYIGYLVMMEFILELLLGFLYVWYVGGLDWE